MSEIVVSHNLTGGTVSVEDGQRTAEKQDQYDVSRKVRVELGFEIYEGQEDQAEAIVSGVCDIASANVARLLGRTASVAPAAGDPALTAQPTKTRRTKAQIAADEAAAAAAKTDPAAIGGAETDPVLPAADAVANPADEWDVAPAATTVVEVTDADLNAAVQKRNGELGDPVLIRSLIATYNPDPTAVFQLRQIPQEKRSEFIAKLAALTKPA